MILNKSKTSQCEEFRIYSKRSENLRMVLFDNEAQGRSTNLKIY